MNPWKTQFLDICRNVLRFGLWICIVINGLCLGLFSVFFTAEFLRYLWSYCQRTIFDKPW